jgi:hypothetical protein
VGRAVRLRDRPVRRGVHRVDPVRRHPVPARHRGERCARADAGEAGDPPEGGGGADRRGAEGDPRGDRIRQSLLRRFPRRHPHGDRAAADPEDRPGRGEAPHRAKPERPGCHGSPAVPAGRGRRRVEPPLRGLRDAPRPVRGALRGRPPGLHPRAAGAADPPVPPPAGVPGDVRAGRGPVRGGPAEDQRLPAGGRRAGGVHLPARPRVHGARARDGRGLREQRRRRATSRPTSSTRAPSR